MPLRNFTDISNLARGATERMDLGRSAFKGALRNGSGHAFTAVGGGKLQQALNRNDIRAPLGSAFATLGDNLRFGANSGDALHSIGQNMARQEMWGGLSGINQVLQNAAQTLLGVGFEARAEGHGGWADGLAIGAEQLAHHARGDRKAAASPSAMLEGLSDLADALPHLKGQARAAATLAIDALTQSLQETFMGPSDDLMASLFGQGAVPGQRLPFDAMDFLGFSPISEIFNPGFGAGFDAGFNTGFDAGLQAGMDTGGFGLLGGDFFAGAFPAQPGGLLFAGGNGGPYQAVGLLL